MHEKAKGVRGVRRRELLKGITAAAFGSCLKPSCPEVWAEALKQRIKTVYVIYKCHLDLGFTDFERVVIRDYFDNYLPQAMDIAKKLRESDGEERYVWTIAAWMLYQYLEQASADQRKRMEQAVTAGDIVWHALPFTWNSEMLDRSLMASSLKLSAALDRRFGKKTIAGKLTDVPCHTRGLVGPLAEAGIRFLDIGANGSCAPPDVPVLKNLGATAAQQPQPTVGVRGVRPANLFNWRDPEGAEIMVLYHPHDPGTTTVAIPGTEIAVSVRVRGENTGTHTIKEIKASYAELHATFPGARIVPTDLSTVANALEPRRSGLPVVTQEMGDTWIYGVGADPGKVAQYRELCRLRREWLSNGNLKLGDAVDLAFVAQLILATDHNWGLDVWKFLLHPEVYTPKELTQARANMPEFKKMDAGWVEKREDVEKAVSVLPPVLQEESKKRLQTLTPKSPETRDLAPLGPGEEVHGAHFIVALDPATGSIRRLQDRKRGREWASPQHLLASFCYQAFTSADFKSYNTAYNGRSNPAFCKPGIERYPVQSRTWQPTLKATWAAKDALGHRIVAELRLPKADPDFAGLVSWPQRLTMEIGLPNPEPAIHVTFQCFNKVANRLAEAMWLSFSPDAPDDEGWSLEKVDRPVSPHDVIAGGSRHMHAVTRDVRYHDANGSFTLQTLDAPLVSPGQRGLLVFDDTPPDMRGGVHVNLFNNLWGTAFPQWYEKDMRFRFVILV